MQGPVCTCLTRCKLLLLVVVHISMCRMMPFDGEQCSRHHSKHEALCTAFMTTNQQQEAGRRRRSRAGGGGRNLGNQLSGRDAARAKELAKKFWDTFGSKVEKAKAESQEMRSK